MSNATFRVGPCSVLYGNPATADGAGMTNLGDIEQVSFNPGIASTGVTTAQTHDAYDADGIYALPPNPTAEASLYNHAASILEKLVMGGEVFTGAGTETALGFGGPIEKVAVATLALIPTFEKDLGAAAPNGIWIPAAMIENLQGFVYNRMSSGGNSGQTFSVTFKGARRATAQSWDGTAAVDVALPSKAQFAFIGDPKAVGLDWTVPAL